MTRRIPELTAEQRAEFVTAARGFMGAPWRHQGRRPYGMDCIGLVVLSLAAIGISTDQRTDYGRTPHNGRLRRTLIEHFGDPIPFSDLMPGCIVTMRWRGEENHVAIVTDHPDGFGLLHCYARAPGGQIGGRVIEHRLAPEWRDLIVEAWTP